MAIRFNSLAVPVTLTLVGITTLLIGGAGALSYRSMRVILQDDLKHDHVNLVDQLAVALELPVWNFEREQIERILEGAMKVDHVDRVAVRLTGGKDESFVRTRGSDWQSPEGSPEQTIIIATRPIVAGGETVGQLELSSTTRLMEEELTTYRWGLIAAVAVIEVLMVVTLYLLLQKIVLRPLNEIERFATIGSPDDERFRRLASRRYVGELEGLRQSLDAKIRQLSERHAALLRSSELLAAERSKLRTVLKIVPAGVATIDSAQTITDANPEFERMLELPATKRASGQNLRRHYFDANGTEISPAQHPNVRAILEQREVRDFEMQLETETGKIVWMSVSAAPLSAQSAVVAIFDITQHKKFEQELKKQIDELRRWHHVTLDRERRVQSLKVEVNELCGRLGAAPRYPSQIAPSETEPAEEELALSFQ